MSSIILLCPYFGKLPEYQYPLWLQSCRYNPSVDWLVITDDKTKYDYPANVKVQYSCWEDFRKRVLGRFNFPVVLDRPYKLCDYKPLYGILFQEEVNGYDFWGYTDCSDTIYGDLRKFLTEEVLAGSDKIMLLGHFALYRNISLVNERYKLPSKCELTYKDVLSTEKILTFDEIIPPSINRIFRENGYSITVIPDFCFDITQKHCNFRQHVVSEDWMNFYDPTGKDNCVLWKNGKLFACCREGMKVIRKEIGYAHFQKRRMKGTIRKDSAFYIVPNKFISEPLCFSVLHFIFYATLPIYKYKLRLRITSLLKKIL